MYFCSVQYCSGLSEKLVCLNIWSPVDGNVKEWLGYMALLKEMYHCDFEVSKDLNKFQYAPSVSYSGFEMFLASCLYSAIMVSKPHKP